MKAVDNLSLTMFRNEIVVLLGHNGAGKTTTISMLIGDIMPNSGEAKAFGKDLLGDQTNLVDFIGVCPQENVLFEKMTTYENLEFFCNFKGVEEEVIEEMIGKELNNFNLGHRRDAFVADLSGG